jgi:hypothetical protein
MGKMISFMRDEGAGASRDLEDDRRHALEHN